MSLRTPIAFMAGVVTAGHSVSHAVHALGAGSASGASLLAILILWAAGVAATTFGTAITTYFALGLVELWWRDRRQATPSCGAGAPRTSHPSPGNAGGPKGVL